jgi:hypothetical protein
MVWVEVIESIKVNECFSATFLWHHRTFLEREQTHQDIFLVSGSMKVKKHFTLTGGLIYFKYHKLSAGTYLSLPEMGPFQALTYTAKLGKWKTSFRTMVEQRYLSKVHQGEILDGHQFNWRFRNRIRVSYPLTERFILEISEEFLFNGSNLTVDFFSQNRAMARLHYKVGSFDINMSYLHWLVNTKSEMQHRLTLMLGLSHKLKL